LGHVKISARIPICTLTWVIIKHLPIRVYEWSFEPFTGLIALVKFFCVAKYTISHGKLLVTILYYTAISVF
jgi:hypothetical protein